MRPPGRDLPEQPPARRGLGGHARRHVPAIELAVGKQRAAPRARSDGVEERRQSTMAMAMAHGKRPPARQGSSVQGGAALSRLPPERVRAPVGKAQAELPALGRWLALRRGGRRSRRPRDTPRSGRPRGACARDGELERGRADGAAGLNSGTRSTSDGSRASTRRCACASPARFATGARERFPKRRDHRIERGRRERRARAGARKRARARDRFQRTDANMSVDELGRTAQLFWLNLCAHFSHS